MTAEIEKRMRTVQTVIETLKIYQYDPPDALTPHFGFMKFDEYEVDFNTRLSQYIRLNLDTTADTVVRFMKDGWCLPPPDLIISVTGGAKNFIMSARLRKIFQRGLVAAAVTTNAWIITAGTNAGVVKEVGQALSNYRYKNRKQGLDVPCIGIASWGYTAGNEQLADIPHVPSSNVSYNRGLRPFTKTISNQTIQAVRMGIADEYCARPYIVKERKKGQCDLEPNHSHFLLFDDGQESADNVLQLRAEIEKCSRKVNLGTGETTIPIVMVLVEGGASSIRTICQALESNTPVVVVKDSGRAADLVANLHACIFEGEGGTGGGNGQHSRPPTGHTRGGSKDAEINAILTKAQAEDERIKEVTTDLRRILYERIKLVTIFKFDGKRHNGNLEEAILEALFNAAKFEGDQNEQQRRINELKLAMAWHKFDYAQKNILTDKTISQWKEDDLRRALVDALRRGHVDFVELLIEFGTQLEKLTVDDLKSLYQTTLTGNRLPIRIRDKTRTPKLEEFYTDYFGAGLYTNNMTGLKDTDLLGNIAARELFFWALFLDRFELATYLCSKTWNPAIAPLFGARIYRQAVRLTLDSDTKEEYDNNAHQFDNHAAAIIDRCFDRDENFGVDLAKRPAPAFQNVDPLKLAKRSGCRSFLASKCVQRHLDNEWFGYINYKRKTINFRIFLCSLFIPLVPLFCFLLPYVEKHKKLTRSPRDSTKVQQPIMVQEAVETDKKRKQNLVSWTEKIAYFYKAPIVRFYYYMIFFVIFLALYSFVLLVDYFPINNYGGRRSGVQGLRIPITEIILHICLWSLIIEEIREFIFTKPKKDYISDIWNIIDVAAISLYLVGFITRFIFIESLFAVSKIFLCLDLILWYVRTLHLFSAYEQLGPKLLMILKTMKDLLFFVCFLFIFLLAYSVASWSLIHTTDQVTWNYGDDGTYNVSIAGGGSGLWTWQLLHDVTNFGVWKIFGQVDPISGTDSYSAVAFVLAILFLAIANVLLLNVLVALFNLTIQNVHTQSHRIWRYQRFLIVYEYMDKPPLPPPVNSIYYVFAATRYIIRRIRQLCQRHSQIDSDMVFVRADNPKEHQNREEFKITDTMQRESAIADDYWRSTLKHGKQEQIEIALQNIDRKLHDLRERIHNSNQVINFDQQWWTSDT